MLMYRSKQISQSITKNDEEESPRNQKLGRKHERERKGKKKKGEN